MDASKITVCKQDMTVVRQEQLGLSPFGFLSKLFQEELEQRVRQQAGLGYGPVPLTLLEEEDGEEQTPPAQPLEVQLQLDIHLDAPKSADKKQPEKKPPAKPEPPETRILERVRLREQELREKQEIIHRLELRLNGRRWDSIRLPVRQSPAPHAARARPLPVRRRSERPAERTARRSERLPPHTGRPPHARDARSRSSARPGREAPEPCGLRVPRLRLFRDPRRPKRRTALPSNLSFPLRSLRL